MRTVLAVGLISAGLYASVLGLAPAPAQTTATASEEVTSDGAAEQAATPDAAAEQAVTSDAAAEQAATSDAAAQEPAPEGGAAPNESPEPTATPVESATPEPPAETPAPEASQEPAATPEATPATAPATATATPEPAAAAPPEPGEAVTPVKTRRHPGGRVNTTAGEGAVRRSEQPRRGRTPTLTLADGSPAPSNPDFSLAVPGVAPIGVPDFFIDKFRIPPFLLPIYQAAGVEYGVQWEVLAAINEIETDYGRNLGVSSAGAVGWMQFMPATWEEYGVDASGDGVKDPFNPVDAIFAAARYLQAAGAEDDIRRALFAYNHADWYVDAVLMRAQLLGRLPYDLVGSLTGLTEGRFPVQARARYAGGSPARIYARAGARVVAVANGRVVSVGRSRLVLQDVYGNTYTYGNLDSVLDVDPTRPKGVRVVGGTVIGRIGGSDAPHLQFEIRPAGRGAPRIDPKPILDGWKLLESTTTYRANGVNPFLGAGAETPTIGQMLLLSKEQLIQRVLNERRIEIYGCGTDDIRSGQIDRRVLATMLYLAASGLKPTISSLKCGHSYLTASGNVSEHSTGTAMDIAAVNGIAIQPSTQGPGSITDMTIQALLQLQGTMKPHQIISLMTFDGADNTTALSDHDDHIHVGWRPLYGADPRATSQVEAALQPDQWIKLVDRLGDIDNPTIPRDLDGPVNPD